MLPVPFPNPHTYAGHSGVDFPQRRGTPVPASGRGRVTFRGYLNPRAAYSVIVAYDNGPSVLYCHYDSLAGTPAVNARVDAGSILGLVGSKGMNSTGPHLHLEIMSGRGAHTYAGVWNYFTTKTVSGGQTAPVTKTKRKQRTAMATLYYTTDQYGKPWWALAGDSPGTPANWIETQSQARANAWASAMGSDVSVPVTQNEWHEYRLKYIAPVAVQTE